jgi:hypothetical protein
MGIRAQCGEDEGRILLGDNTGGAAGLPCVCVCTVGGAKNVYTLFIITVAICSRTFAQKMALIK